MGLFGFGKKDKVIDLTKHYKKQQEKLSNIREEMQGSQTQNSSQETSSGNPFSMFGGSGASSNSSTDETNYVGVSENANEKKRKLTKRLIDMTNKMEELSNQIYRLQQRIEVLERKSGVGGF